MADEKFDGTISYEPDGAEKIPVIPRKKFPDTMIHNVRYQPSSEELKKCVKIVIKYDGETMEEKLYCILSAETVVNKKRDTNEKLVYKIPAMGILIDEKSSHLFKHPELKVFVAIPTGFELKDKTPIYFLQPLSDEEDMERREYSHPELLGEGAYGLVNAHRPYGMVEKLSKNSEGDLWDYFREIGIYRLLGNVACLPNMYDFQLKGDFPRISLQLGAETLKKFYTKNEPDLRVLKKIFFDLATCLFRINTQGVIHADLKPDNIIISKNNFIQIIDWGIASIDRSENQGLLKNSVIQTRLYRAPEVLLGNLQDTISGRDNPIIYTHKIDIFSLGLIFMECVLGYAPIQGDSNLTQIRGYFRNIMGISKVDLDNDLGNNRESENKNYARILNREINAVPTEQSENRSKMTLSEFSPKIKDNDYFLDLITGMLRLNPHVRLNYEQILTHPFFADFMKFPVERLISNIPVFIERRDLIPSLKAVWEGEKIEFSMETRAQRIRRFFRLAIDNHFNISTCCATIQFMDYIMYSQGRTLQKKSDILNIVYFASISLATKLYEPDCISYDSLYLYDNERKHVLEMEKFITESLEGDIYMPTLGCYWMKYNSPLYVSGDIANIFINTYLRDDVYARKFSDSWEELLG